MCVPPPPGPHGPPWPTSPPPTKTLFRSLPPKACNPKHILRTRGTTLRTLSLKPTAGAGPWGLGGGGGGGSDADHTYSTKDIHVQYCAYTIPHPVGLIVTTMLLLASPVVPPPKSLLSQRSRGSLECPLERPLKCPS